MTPTSGSSAEVLRSGHPTVGELSSSQPVLPDTTTCRDVDAWFRSSPERRSVLLGRPDGSVNLVNRSAFYQHLVGPLGFGWTLFSSKPVSRLPIPRPLVLAAGTSAVDGGLDLIAHGVVGTDDILVLDDTGGPTTVPVSRILAEVARAQRSEADRLTALLANLSDVVLVVDPTGRVSYASPSLAPLWGEPIDAVGSDGLAAIHPDDRVRARSALHAACEQPDVTVRSEARLLRPDGGCRFLDLAVTDRRNQAGIGGIVVTCSDVTEHRALEAELRHQALHDELTGLANRTLLADRIDHAISGTRRDGSKLALVYVDLDDFKKINDRHGHAAGDDLLRAVGASLSQTIRASDTAARIGGDEFVVLLERIGSVADSMAFASRLHRALEALEVDGRRLGATASIGIAVLDRDDPIDAEAALRRADTAMYLAKSAGPGRSIRWESTLQAQADDAERLLGDLIGAADAGQFRLQFQPIVDVADQSYTALEALVRWDHPLRGVVPPAEFIPVAERSGLMPGITRWVLRRACEQGRRIIDEHGGELTIAVNLSGPDLSRADLADDVAQILLETGMPARLLELEVTETALVSNFAVARQSVQRLKALGVALAIDDFGTGYSSLNYLQELPVDRIKIDKSFIDRLADHAGAKLVAGVIDLAHSLGLKVTAEGIETTGQAQRLAAMQCDQGQGYVYARPAAVEDLLPVAQPKILPVAPSEGLAVAPSEGLATAS